MKNKLKNLSLLRELRKFVPIKVLEHFIKNPTQEFYAREIATAIKASPASVKNCCDLLAREGILKSRKRGRMIFYKLDNDIFLVKELKRAYHLLLLKEAGIEKICSEGTIAIYGSISIGDVDERSDIDVLVIGYGENVDFNTIKKIENNLGRKIHLTIFTPIQWEALKKRGDPFVKNVLKNHILVRGAEL